MNNSSATLNHLHLGDVYNQQALSVFTAGLINNSLQIMKLRVGLFVRNCKVVTVLTTGMFFAIQ